MIAGRNLAEFIHKLPSAVLFRGCMAALRGANSTRLSHTFKLRVQI